MEKQMIVGVQGTSGFNDYKVFLRAMGVVLSTLSNADNELYIYSAGPGNVNDMVSEFTNISMQGLKSRGKKVKVFKVAPSWISENMESFNYFAFFSLPGEQASKLVSQAQLNNVEVGIFNY
jgi:hypothetical protein